MSTRAHIAALGMMSVMVASCETTGAEYIYGVSLAQVELVVVYEDMGVHPSTSVLDDPNNPFAFGGMSEDARWEILDAGHWPATFYAWATYLSGVPTGEAQYYTALSAHSVYDRHDVDRDQLVYVRQIAIDGYQAVLDEFPGALTFDATGEVGYPLAPLAYQGIEALGGTPQGWVLVTGDDGRATVVPIAAPAEEAE